METNIIILSYVAVFIIAFIIGFILGKYYNVLNELEAKQWV